MTNCSYPCPTKVLEEFVVSWMIKDIGEYIDPNQFGSLKGSSTTFCLLDLIHNWLSEMDNPGCYIRACFLDFSKAFDKIDHIIVIKKFIDLGVRRSITPWICSFVVSTVNVSGSVVAYLNGYPLVPVFHKEPNSAQYYLSS